MVLVSELTSGAQVCIEISNYVCVCALLCQVAMDPVCVLLVKTLKLLLLPRTTARRDVDTSKQNVTLNTEDPALCLEPEGLQAVANGRQRLHKVCNSIVDKHSYTPTLQPGMVAGDRGGVNGVLGEQVFLAFLRVVGAGL